MADNDPSTPRREQPRSLTFFGLLTAGGLIAMPFIAGPPDGDRMPDIVRFIGHFHPVLLHFPIGVFALILLQELVALFGKRGDVPENPSLLPLLFGAASAIVAAIAGFLLYQGGEEYAGDALIGRHLWGGLIFAAASVLTLIAKAWTVSLAANPAFYRVLLLGSVGVMAFASHDGAVITHGEGYLTSFAPDPIRNLMGLVKKDSKNGKSAVAPNRSSADPVVYADIVAPILERRCSQCHKQGKAKGKFQMDTYELLVKGGKEGSGIEPGKSAESNIIIRVDLPADDEEHMPPEGKPDIEESEVAILKWWIDSGADPKKKISEFDVPAPIREAITKLAPGPSRTAGSSAPHAESTGPDEALKSAVARISREFPGTLGFESQQSALLAFTAVSLRGNLDDAAFQKFESVTSRFVTVDLSATKITDRAVAQLVSAKNLRLIRLAETGITDVAIDTLVKLPALESINLYGTKVTDAGVGKLSALPNLKRLYLWKTAVTPEAIKTLKEKLPACEIVTGTDP